MIALAWQHDQTRVATMRMVREASMRVYSVVDVNEAFHPLSHHQEDEAKFEKLVRVQRYHTERFAGFIERLSQIPDGEGSLLDHAVILFGSNMSNSDLHNNDPLPQLIAGHAGGIRGGQHLAYPQDTPHANLLLTMMQRAGVPVESFGDSTGAFAEV